MKDSQNQLIQCIVKDDAFRVKALLKEDPGLVRARDPEGRTPLLLALYFGHEELARIIKGKMQELDIFEAAAMGDVEGLARHLEGSEGAVRAVAQDGFTPLGLAVYFGRPEAARALLDAGADPNAPASNAMKVRPMHSAAAHRDAARSLDLCRLLLERGADPNVSQAGGWTPLHQAAAHGRKELVELLLSHGASRETRSDDDRTPAQMAALKGHKEIEALLSPSST